MPYTICNVRHLTICIVYCTVAVAYIIKHYTMGNGYCML